MIAPELLGVPLGANLPDWMREPTRVFPTMRPGSPGRLTRAQEWRANGGRW